MKPLSPTEHTSRKVYAALMNIALKRQDLQPGASSDATLIALAEEDIADLRLELKKGAGLKGKEQFDEQAVVSAIIRANARLYAVARNNGLMNVVAFPMLEKYVK